MFEYMRTVVKKKKKNIRVPRMFFFSEADSDVSHSYVIMISMEQWDII